MPLNPQIPLQGQGVQMPNFLGMMAQAEQTRGARQNREMKAKQAKLIDDEAVKADKKNKTFSDLYLKSKGDFGLIAQGLASAGYGDEAVKTSLQGVLQKKQKTEQDKLMLDLEDKVLKQALPLALKMTPEARQGFLMENYSRSGLDPSEIEQVGPIDDELYQNLLQSHGGGSGGKYAPEIVYGPNGEIYQASRQPGQTQLQPYTLPSGIPATKFVKPELVQSGGGQYYVDPVTGTQSYVGPSGRPGQLIETDDGTLVLPPGTDKAVPVSQPSGKPVSKIKITPEIKEKIRTKLNTVRIMRTQLENVKKKFDAIKGTNLASQPIGGGFSKGGRSFDSAVDALRTTVRQLTRTPGEGSMSDWEGQLNMAQLPKREIYDDVTQQQIDQLETLINTIEDGYSGYNQNGYIPEVKAPTGLPPEKQKRLEELRRKQAEGTLK